MDIAYLQPVLTQSNAAGFALRMASAQEMIYYCRAAPTVHAADTTIINQLRAFSSLREAN